MDQYPQKHKLPKLTQEIDYLNLPIKGIYLQEREKEIGGGGFQESKLQGLMTSLMHSTKHLRKKKYYNPQSFQETEGWLILPNLML